MRDEFPAQLRRQFIAAAAAIGAVTLGALVLHFIL